MAVVAGLGHYNITSVPTKLGGDLTGVNIVQVATYGDCCLAVSAEGGLFGWGNSEYLQLAAVTDSTQVRGRPQPGLGGLEIQRAKGVDERFFRGAWAAQLVQCLTLDCSSCHGLRVVGLSPTLGSVLC